MHSRSDNIEIRINDEVDEVKKELFDLLKNKYRKMFEPIKRSQFVLDYVQIFYYTCHKINQYHGRSYIDSPYWIKTKMQQ